MDKSIDTYASPDLITPEHFVTNYVQKNKPCVIRNFFQKDANDKKQCSIRSVIQSVHNKESNKKLIEYTIGNVRAYDAEWDYCSHVFIDYLKNDKDLIVRDNMRTWKHNKGNLTQWHYDGDGADLLNICLQGSKRFYLARPGKFFTMPLTNLTIPQIHYDEEYLTELYEGDMLYIPAFWFHKVLTLENDSLNVNVKFYNKHLIKFASKRDIDVYHIHSLLNTEMCTKNAVCSITDTAPRNLLRAFFTFFIEMIPAFILYTIFAMVIRNKRIYVGFNIALILFSIYIISSNELNDKAYGILRVIGMYSLIYIILFNGIFYKPLKKRFNKK